MREKKKHLFCHKAKASANVMVTARVPINNFLSHENTSPIVPTPKLANEEQIIPSKSETVENCVSDRPAG